MYKIEDNIPFKRKHAFWFMKDMEIWQSFLVGTNKEVVWVTNYANYALRKDWMKFSRKSEGEWYRIWRIK